MAAGVRLPDLVLAELALCKAAGWRLLAGCCSPAAGGAAAAGGGAAAGGAQGGDQDGCQGAVARGS